MSYKVNTNARYIVKDAIDKLGLTHSKISEICNVSIGSIKRWISTGRANAEKIKPLENLLTGISTKNFVKSIEDVGEVLIKIYEKRNIFSIKSSTLSIMSGRTFIHDKFISQLSEYLLDRGFYILKNRNLECELYSIIGVDHLLKINSLTEEELMKSDFSEKELKLIEDLSPIRYKEIINDKSDISPITLFEEIALDCFLENDWGTEVESLRKMLKALKSGVVFRKTEEFENLIEVEEA